MAAEENSMVEVQRNELGFMAILTSALCEWFLIFLLLIDAALSYLLTKFADYCKLQTPCILCSRLDHVIGDKRPGFYRNLLCSSHISEISSLISCNIHGKLADCRGMCDDCIFSFTTTNMSYSEMHKILEAKLGMDIGGSSLPRLFLNKDFLPGSVGSMQCSCCGEPWRPSQNAQRFFQLKSSGNLVSLPSSPSHTCSHPRTSFKNMSNKFHDSVPSPYLGKSGFGSLSHVGYTELKINSDSESEVLFSDDNDDDISTSSILENKEAKEGFAVQCSSEIPCEAPPNDFVSAKVTICSYNSKPLLSDLFVHPDVSKAHDVNSLAFDGAASDCLNKLNWEDAHQKPNPFTLPELILLDEIPASSNVVGISHEESVDNKLKFPLPEDFNPLRQCQLISFNYSPLSGGASSAKYVTGSNDIGHACTDSHKDVLRSLSTSCVTCTETDQVILSPASENSKHIGIINLSEPDGNHVEGESSALIAEETIMGEPDKHDNEPKPFLSLAEDNSDQGFDLSSENARRKEHDHGDAPISFNPNETQMLRKSVSVESSLESLDVSYVSEIEGESFIDQLKRQVEHDKKCMKSLYKELEEERNASAIAANQAMAMITRLQEEKAALHMEALQYLRMMEEQAEYDVEALEKANDLLAEKEKEIQDMEAELETCRLNSPDETTEDVYEGRSELKGKRRKVDNFTVACQDHLSPFNMTITEELKDSAWEPFAAEIPRLEFEDERLYVSKCLQSLEMQLHQISCSGNFSDKQNGGHSEKFADERPKGHESPANEGILLDSPIEECDSSMKEDLHKCNGSSVVQEGTMASDRDNWLCKANNLCESNGAVNSSMVALEHEISDLNDRLEALEHGHHFLKHMLTSLESGNEGVQFIREVAHQLQELRRMGIRLRSQPVP